MKYPIYVGGVQVIEQIFATDELTIPLSVVLDQDGKVIESISGWSPESKQKFEALLDRSVGAAH